MPKQRKVQVQNECRVGLHCRDRAPGAGYKALEDALSTISKGSRRLDAPRIDIARPLARDHPPHAAPAFWIKWPRQLCRQFGGVFSNIRRGSRNAPSSLKLGLSHNLSRGFKQCTGAMFRSATGRDDLGVLTGAPDLAGKPGPRLKRLTRKHARASQPTGLDALTDCERTRRERLKQTNNESPKHGFRLIIAVKDHDKDGHPTQF